MVMARKKKDADWVSESELSEGEGCVAVSISEDKKYVYIDAVDNDMCIALTIDEARKLRAFLSAVSWNEEW